MIKFAKKIDILSLKSDALFGEVRENVTCGYVLRVKHQNLSKDEAKN